MTRRKKNLHLLHFPGMPQWLRESYVKCAFTLLRCTPETTEAMRPFCVLTWFSVSCEENAFQTDIILSCFKCLASNWLLNGGFADCMMQQKSKCRGFLCHRVLCISKLAFHVRVNVSAWMFFLNRRVKREVQDNSGDFLALKLHGSLSRLRMLLLCSMVGTFESTYLTLRIQTVS